MYAEQSTATIDPVTDPSPSIGATVRSPHWHQVGQSWRPLHEQVKALRDAGDWGTVTAGAGGGPLLADVDDGVAVSVARSSTRFALVVVSGSLDLRSVRQLASELRELLNAGVCDLVLDLAQLSGCDLRLAAVLLPLRARVHARAGTLVLMNPSPRVRQVLDVGALPHSFLLCPACE